MQPSARPASVLIVDDDPLIRLTLAAALESRGYEASAVAAPAEGAGADADAVLLDALVPGCSLTESLALLRHRDDGRPRPILVMSGSPARPAELAGSDIPFLAKPIGLAEFFRAVEALVPAHPAPAAPQATTEDHER